MSDKNSLIGTWVSIYEDCRIPGNLLKCIWHVLDDTTCVYEQQTEVGFMILWFQYWRKKMEFLDIH
jgi:hypothetical protein